MAPINRLMKNKRTGQHVFSFRDLGITVGALVLATCLGFVFEYFGLGESSIILLYIIAVMFIAALTAWQRYSLVSSFVGVLVFNFFFTEPRLTLLAYEKEYPVTFLIMFVAAFLTSSLAVRLKSQARKAAQAAYRTKILLETNQLLEQAKSREDILEITAKQLEKLLSRIIIFYLTEKEIPSDEKYIYYPVRMEESVYGVIGISRQEKEPDHFENSILLSVLGECSLALENDKNRKEKEKAAALAEKEKLRANLMRMISHDLRTPLTSISGNASNLISNSTEFDEETKQQLYRDIYKDSMWLINLVENLLSVTRIEEGRTNLRMTVELLDEVITEALRHVNRISNRQKICVELPDEMLFVKIDAKLIVQVIINIVDNAMKYTPPGSRVVITAKREGQWTAVSIADNGEGIADEAKEHIFEMFYTGKHKVADSRRSMGVGLSLCKSVIQAHGGKISVSDNVPHGAVFTFTLRAYQPEIDDNMLTGGREYE